MLESTGSHGRGVERRVPEMRRMVEFNCTSTRLGVAKTIGAVSMPKYSIQKRVVTAHTAKRFIIPIETLFD